MSLAAFTNQYQLSKTLRFGFTQKEKVRKENFDGSIYQSHAALRELTIESERLIKGKLKSNTDTALPLEKIRACIEEIKRYTDTWSKIFTRDDQLALSKEYYRVMARKARFDAFWKNYRDVKQPQSQIVRLSSLKSKYNGKERKAYLVDYWAGNLQTVKQRLVDFEPAIRQFESALKDNRTDRKLNEVDFRKMFLSICKLVNETLVPLCNSSLCVPDLEKLLDNEASQELRDFVMMDIFQLQEQIEALKIYFGENGGYVPYGRTTLNKYTALQKPHAFDEEIEAILVKLKLSDVINNLIKQDDVSDYFENVKDKIGQLSNSSMSVIECVQLFKYKPIPVSVRYSLVEYFHRKLGIDKDELGTLLDTIGKPKSPAKDYADLQDKGDFNLYKYPLKVAFDFTWESLAKAQYHEGLNFPEVQCQKFLENIFFVNTSCEAFKTYALLLHLRGLLAKLDHEEPNDREAIIDKAISLMNEDAFPKVPLRGTKGDSANQAILSWLQLSKEEQVYKKEKKDQSYNQYEKAKNKIGLLRGEQKNKIGKYREVTEQFKDLASNFGKLFGALREKFQAKNELNKITHYGTIIEDNNQDRYVLLYPLSEGIIDLDKLFVHEESGTLTSYYVKSLTSKTLNKLIKNKGGFKDFHMDGQQPDWERVKKRWSVYKDDKAFLKYVKRCLNESEMAKAQNWGEFGWDFSSCDSFEEIEREVDKKGYSFKNDRKLSEDTVKRLVKEEKCLLLPIINQDIIVEETKLRNQFSKDWVNIFDADCTEYRLHPEFGMSYRMPTPNYPKPEQKRYSRFQMIGYFQCEIVPIKTEYLSKKEQIEIFNDADAQKEAVEKFNEIVNGSVKPNDYVVIGIDRGLKQLATLCVLNKDGAIQGGFEIYTRSFNADKKQWEHRFMDNRDILDLSNLRVETTVDGKKVLVDLSSIKVKDQRGNYTQDNQQKVKLKQLAYIRKLQYQMQVNPEKVKAFAAQHRTPQDIKDHMKELITPYKEGSHFADLPLDRIKYMLEAFCAFHTENDQTSLRELIELDAADNLKSGIVGNIVGVIAFLLKRFSYNAYISIENLTRAFYNQRDGLSEKEIPRDHDFMDQENLVLAGLGTYHYLEVQLLRKLFRIQCDAGIINLVPAFRSNDNYETIRKLSKKQGVEYVCKPFGIVHFVDPMYTSKKCPACGGTTVQRGSFKDDITCQNPLCGYGTSLDISEKIQKLISANKAGQNIHLISNGDENGAYHIALKTLKNLFGNIQNANNERRYVKSFRSK